MLTVHLPAARFLLDLAVLGLIVTCGSCLCLTEFGCLSGSTGNALSVWGWYNTGSWWFWI